MASAAKARSHRRNQGRRLCHGFEPVSGQQDSRLLGGVASTQAGTGAPTCIGGAAFVNHSINYNNWLPSLAARYSVMGNWSIYAQAAEGSVTPLSSVFDVTGGNVLTPPKPTLAKTYQAGSVLKFNRWTLDMDAYYVHFQNGYEILLAPTRRPGNLFSLRPARQIRRELKQRATSFSVTASTFMATSRSARRNMRAARTTRMAGSGWPIRPTTLKE